MYACQASVIPRRSSRATIEPCLSVDPHRSLRRPRPRSGTDRSVPTLQGAAVALARYRHRTRSGRPPGTAPALRPLHRTRHWEDRIATVDECRTALHQLAARLAANAASSRERLSLDRSLACTIKDLGVSFRARLLDGQLVDITDGD